MLFKNFLRVSLGLFLCATGTAHFLLTDSFQAQVPKFMPAPQMVIYISGVFEIALGLALAAFPKYKRESGLVAALFFIIIFPGNVSQYLTHTSAFGLDTDTERALRLLFQPVLIAVALWSTKVSTKAKN